MDRENVIKGLKLHGDPKAECDECPYRNEESPGYGCLEELCNDVIALLKEQEELLRKLQKDKDKLCLDVSEWKHKYHDRAMKEQEAVEPKKEDDGEPEPWIAWWYVCGDCGQPIDRMDRYCRGCGKQVKWDA